MSIKEQLIQFMEGSGYTQKQVAAKSKISTAVISQYLNGTYNGSIPATEIKLGDFLFREAKRLHGDVAFVPTTLAKTALEIIDITHSDCDIGVIYGAAGMGKSMVLREYALRDSSVILIEADPGYTAKVLLQELAAKLRIKKPGSTIHELSEECIQALRGTGWMVMIDEAELLPYRALEVMRRIQDRANCGLLLAGMPRLIVNLMGAKGEYEQLYSRVSLALDLDDMKALSEESDFTDILRSILKGGLPSFELTSDVLQAFREQSGGNYRRMYKLARSVIRANKTRNQAVSPALINKYGSMLIKRRGVI